MKPGTRTFYETAVGRAVERITASLDQVLDLKSIARAAALSPFHFHRIFRGLVGETPHELHRRLRLERAAEQLVATSRSVTQIALDAGFDTHEAFTRAFGNAYDVSPSEFRARAHAEGPTCHGGPPVELAARCGLHIRSGVVDLAPLSLIHPGGINMNVTIENRPAQRLVCVRHVGPYAEIAEAFHRLGKLAAENGLYAHAQPPMLALYHDAPETTPASELRSDAALVIDAQAVIPPGATEALLPAGPYARTTHMGAYAGLGDAWARFVGEWLPTSGRHLADTAAYEVYVTDPRTTPTADLRTDLYLPLVPDAATVRG